MHTQQIQISHEVSIDFDDYGTIKLRASSDVPDLLVVEVNGYKCPIQSTTLDEMILKIKDLIKKDTNE